MVETPLSPIFDVWPSLADFARDVGIGIEAAKQMRKRQSIAVRHWPAIIRAAAGRGSVITEAQLVACHAPADADRAA